MTKIVVMFLFFLLTGCASIGFDGIEVNPDDTWVTILIPSVLLIALYFVKKEIDLWYLKREANIKGIKNDNQDT